MTLDRESREVVLAGIGRPADCGPELPPDVVRRLYERNPLRVWYVILRDYAVIAAAAWAAERYWHPLVYLLAIIVIAGRISSVAGLGHEAAHYNLFNSKRLNMWVGLACCSSIVLFTITPKPYRKSHLTHHRYGNMPGDPDPAFQGMPILRSPGDVALYLIRGGTLPIRYFFGVLRERPIWQTAGAVVVLAAATWVAPGVSRLLAMYWLIPLATFYSFFEVIRLNAEHNGVSSELPLYRTRTVIPTLLSRLTIAPEYVGYHLAHHIYPAVPFYRRHEMHELLMKSSKEYRENAHITRGYLRMLLELVRYRGGPLIRPVAMGVVEESRA